MFKDTNLFEAAPAAPATPAVVERELWDLRRFVAWLETKDQNEHYDYHNLHVCLIAQYLKAAGAGRIALKSFEIPGPFARVAHPYGHTRSSWTFGLALTRARAELARSAAEQPT